MIPMNEHEACIVLGGGIGRITQSRVIEAAKLLESDTCERFIAVGSVEEAKYMARLASERGIPPEKLIVDGRSENTIDNAYYAKLVCLELGITDIILVTSSFHMERSLEIFRHMFGDAFTIRSHCSVEEVPEATLKREVLLRKLVPLLKAFKSGDHEEMWAFVRKITKGTPE